MSSLAGLTLDYDFGDEGAAKGWECLQRVLYSSGGWLTYVVVGIYYRILPLNKFCFGFGYRIPFTSANDIATTVWLE
jgi:hypothetical protein